MKRFMLSAGGAGDMLPRRRSMNAYTILGYLRWIVPQALLVYLAARMVRNRLVTETPVFFAYVVFTVGKFLLRFIVYHVAGGDSVAYYIAYWYLVPVDAIFGLAVIHELYIVVFRPYQGLALFASGVFKWAAALLILVAAISAASVPESDLNRLTVGIMTLDKSATIVQLGLLTLLFVVTSSLWLVWQRSLLGIALGLTVIISIQLVASALAMRFGLVFNHTYNSLKSVAYLCAVLTWTFYSLRREATITLSLRGDDDLRLQEWNTELLKLLGR
jgi:hypothetical protein